MSENWRLLLFIIEFNVTYSLFILNIRIQFYINSLESNYNDLFGVYTTCQAGHWNLNEPQHEISNNVVCATSKASDQPALTRSLIKAFASRLRILWLLSYWLNIVLRRLHRLAWVYTFQNATLLEITCHGSYSSKDDG